MGVFASTWSNAKDRVPERPGARFLTSMKPLLQWHSHQYQFYLNKSRSAEPGHIGLNAWNQKFWTGECLLLGRGADLFLIGELNGQPWLNISLYYTTLHISYKCQICCSITDTPCSVLHMEHLFVVSSSRLELHDPHYGTVISNKTCKSGTFGKILFG